MEMNGDPFLASRPKQVPLPQSPLVHVLAQIRFPPILAIRSPDATSGFQERLRNDYPVLDREETHQLTLGPGGASQTAEVIWRFSSLDRTWRVSLATGFVALETRCYISRADLLVRLRQVLAATEAAFSPRIATRTGVRYIDRIEGKALEAIQQLVRPEILGLVGTPLAPRLLHGLAEALLEGEEGRLLARWGLLPPQATVDPASYPPVDRQTWMLDLDMFRDAEAPFATDDLAATVERMAEQIYALFRWIVTDDFLRVYGGEP
jgi:uncharacterized protein (TIGR04255 family)